MKNMTVRQARFVEQYLISGNATQAAIDAGYSEKTAYSQGHRLLKNVEIQKAIAEKRAVMAKQTENRLVERVRTSQRILEEARKAGDLRTALSANDQLIKLGGFYAPEKKITLNKEITADEARAYLLEMAERQQAGKTRVPFA